MKRRAFVARAGISLATLSAGSLNRALFAQSPVIPSVGPARRGARKRVIIVGAGLAGLSAGYELTQAGHDVTILEARSRPGGRVHTLRDAFAEGLHTEEGASRIPDHHAFTLKYVSLFGLALEPFQPADRATVYHARGHRMVVEPGQTVDWPYRLTPEERQLGIAGLRRKYIASMFPELGDVTDPSWPPESLKKYDRMNRSDFWRSHGASDEVIELLHWSGFDDRYDTVSALFMLRNAALGSSGNGYSKITGGNDLLPKAFAAKLAEKIRYSAPVVRIEQDDHGVRAILARGSSFETISGDQIICAVPFTVQKNIEVSPAFSFPKQTAIEQLPYRSISKVFVQTRRRFWTEQGLDGFATTDLPIREVWDMSYGQPGTRGILQVYPMNHHSRRLSPMSETERIAFAVDQLELVYPGVRENAEGGATKCWDDDPWARGASAYYKPGQIEALLPHVARPEGRVHFAGEHTSVWVDGWMQGALESGNRVAQEINALA